MKNSIVTFLFSISINFLYSQQWQEYNLNMMKRTGASALVIGGKIYYGLGKDSTWRNTLNDWWEFNPETKQYTRKNNFPVPRHNMRGFVAGGKGYLSFGNAADNYIEYNMYEYDPDFDNWKNIGVLPFNHTNGTTAFTIGEKGYYVFGWKSSCNGSIPYSDNQVWEFTPQTHTWVQKKRFPEQLMRAGAAVAVIGNKAYLGMGWAGGQARENYLPDFWEYDPVNDSWTKKASFPGDGRSCASMFAIGKFIYVCQGNNLYSNDSVQCAISVHDFWRYNSEQDVWENLNTFPYTPTESSQCVVLKGCSYLLGGYSFTNKHCTPVKISGNVTSYCDPNYRENLIHNTLDITVSPNPFHNSVNLQLDALCSPISVYVKNQMGQIILTRHYMPNTQINELLNLEGYNPGIYLLETVSGDERQIKKIVLN